jgi:hypothetical protein
MRFSLNMFSVSICFSMIFPALNRDFHIAACFQCQTKTIVGNKIELLSNFKE